MAEYTSLAMGAGTGLIVFLSTVLYVRRKAKAMRPKFRQGEIRFPEAEVEGSAPELTAHR